MRIMLGKKKKRHSQKVTYCIILPNNIKKKKENDRNGSWIIGCHALKKGWGHEENGHGYKSVR